MIGRSSGLLLFLLVLAAAAPSAGPAWAQDGDLVAQLDEGFARVSAAYWSAPYPPYSRDTVRDVTVSERDPQGRPSKVNGYYSRGDNVFGFIASFEGCRLT